MESSACRRPGHHALFFFRPRFVIYTRSGTTCGMSSIQVWKKTCVSADITWSRSTCGGLSKQFHSTDDKHAKELLVLKVCLAEIERSRPFLIVLVGERYCWIHPEERMKVAGREAAFTGDVAGKSVTALEIAFGALSSPDQLSRTWFYFRDPLQTINSDVCRRRISVPKPHAPSFPATKQAPKHQSRCHNSDCRNPRRSRKPNARSKLKVSHSDDA